MLETTQASEEYKKVARRKLDSMLGLCEVTTCRRQFLLEYFGELDTKSCGNCDTCLDPVELIDATVDAQKILSTIYRTGQAFGAGHIIDVLRGSKGVKVIERGHDKLSVYGIGKDKTKTEWNIILRSLLNLKYLAIKNWDYRNFVLTETSAPLLKGEEKFFSKKRANKSYDLSKQSNKQQKEIASTHDRHDLFEDLRNLRYQLAKENNVPPYVIFSDKSLHDMCQLMPRNRDEFLMVNGVGQSKCEKYSSEFLGKISSFSL